MVIEKGIQARNFSSLDSLCLLTAIYISEPYRQICIVEGETRQQSRDDDYGTADYGKHQTTRARRCQAQTMQLKCQTAYCERRVSGNKPAIIWDESRSKRYVIADGTQEIHMA